MLVRLIWYLREPLNKSGPKRSVMRTCPFEAQIARNSRLLRRFGTKKLDILGARYEFTT